MFFCHKCQHTKPPNYAEQEKIQSENTAQSILSQHTSGGFIPFPILRGKSASSIGQGSYCPLLLKRVNHNATTRSITFLGKATARQTCSSRGRLPSSSPTERPSISYNLRFLSEESTHEGQAAFLKGYLQQLPKDKKMAVFAGSCENVGKLVESTGLPSFYHDLPDKQKQLTKFLGSSQAIITTTDLAWMLSSILVIPVFCGTMEAKTWLVVIVPG